MKMWKEITKKLPVLILGLFVLVGCLLGCFFKPNKKTADWDFYPNEEIIEDYTQRTEENIEFPKEKFSQSNQQNIDGETKSGTVDKEDTDVQEYNSEPEQKFVIEGFPVRNKNDTDGVGFLTGRSEDGFISLKWEIPATKAVLTVNIGEKKSHSILVEQEVKGSGKYRFTEGKHGQKYSFTLNYTNDDGKQQTKKVTRRFLNFDKLPKLDTLYIETQDERDPQYEIAKKPVKNLFGLTIINNEYKEATLNGDKTLKIRVRGNSSAYGTKKSYKLVFTEKQDLMGLGEEYADKEWILLGKTYMFQTYMGFRLGTAVGMEWEPRMRFVNVMMNGDWKGLYILCESVKRHPKRVAIDEDGFLIESDGYYWKEKGAVFRSPLLSTKVGFTFKYPKLASKSDERFGPIEQRIKTIDDAVKNKSANISDLIDFETFATWALVHEILGTTDGLGSNMFFYQASVGKKTKLKMGPLWDFDSSYPRHEKMRSVFWSATGTYLPYLLKFPEFEGFYRKKYASLVDTIQETIDSVVQDLRNIPGLEESAILDGKVFRNGKSFDEELDKMTKRLHSKVQWLSTELGII